MPESKPRTELASGNPVPQDGTHTELKSNGQQRDYVVLSPEERAKGFVRPVRRTYRHVGPPPTANPLRDLTDEEHAEYDQFGYVKYESYPPSGSAVVGKLWTQAQLDAIGKGCNTTTTMSQSIAETYARDPRFYGGTFCVACGKHLPVDHFVWEDDGARVGS